MGSNQTCFVSRLQKAKPMNPESVIEEVIASGLLGRGGAGFSCGLKWKPAREQSEKEKFITCNADEGEVWRVIASGGISG